MGSCYFWLLLSGAIHHSAIHCRFRQEGYVCIASLSVEQCELKE